MELLAASIGRPNALDAEVNAITAHALLTGSPLTLLDVAREAAAARLESFRVPMWLGTTILQIIALAWFWSTGYSARLRDWLRARVGSEFLVRFCFGAALALLDKLVVLIPQAVQYRFLRLMDLNEVLFRAWLADWIAGTLITMAVVGLTAAIVLWLADRTHQWYIYTIAGVIGFTLVVAYVTPFVFAPVTVHYTTLAPSGRLKSDILILEQRTHTKVPILEEHIGEQTRVGNTYITGWGGTQRIVLSDTLLLGASEPELRFVIARSLEWIAANLALQMTLVQGAFIVVGVALAVLFSDRVGFRRDDDPVSRLALLGAVIGCVYLVALPLYNGYARQASFTMDQAAVALTGDPTSAIRLVVREADQSLQRVCPSRLSRWYLTSRPVGDRIARLQDRPDVCSTQRP